MITVNKPVLGIREVTVLDVTKKGTEDRFTVTIEMKLKNSERSFKDVIFFDAENTSRVAVYPAILRALAEQIELPESEFIVDNGETIDYDDAPVLEAIKGKDIVIERTSVNSDRNGKTYYNVSYRPNQIEQEDVEV